MIFYIIKEQEQQKDVRQQFYSRHSSKSTTVRGRIVGSWIIVNIYGYYVVFRGKLIEIRKCIIIIMIIVVFSLCFLNILCYIFKYFSSKYYISILCTIETRYYYNNQAQIFVTIYTLNYYFISITIIIIIIIFNTQICVIAGVFLLIGPNNLIGFFMKETRMQATIITSIGDNTIIIITVF